MSTNHRSSIQIGAGPPKNPMAKSKILKLYASAFAAGNAAAYLTVPQSGLITSISWAVVAVAGAATTGLITYELALNSSVSTISTNDTPGTSLDHCALALSTASAAGHTNKSTAGLAIPVAAGDRLYVHLYSSGQAAGSGFFECTVAVTA